MSSVDKLYIEKLMKHFYDDNFQEIVYEIEKDILSNNSKLNKKWKQVYDSYCDENKPGTDEFSYSDLGDMFVKHLGIMKNTL